MSPKELKALKQLANVLIGFSDEELRRAISAGELMEVRDGGDEKKG